jgi:hypothetical protein
VGRVRVRVRLGRGRRRVGRGSDRCFFGGKRIDMTDGRIEWVEWIGS